MTPNFGDPIQKIPPAYAQKLVYGILNEKPELAENMEALLKEVAVRKHYEVRDDTATKLARNWRKENPNPLKLI